MACGSSFKIRVDLPDRIATIEQLSDIGFSFEQSDWFLRLLVAMACGAVLGIDREMRHRRVGVRTYMLVSLGAAAFALVSVEMAKDMTSIGLSGDPTRIIQGIVGGLGFLGAGAIIQGERRIGGMATAASLWVSGAVGLAAGLGYAAVALTTAALAAAVLLVSKFMKKRGADDRPEAE